MTARQQYGASPQFPVARTMDPFVQQLASLRRARVARCKWVFVPNHGVDRAIGKRIPLDGTNWLNLRFVTALDVALVPFLVEQGGSICLFVSGERPAGGCASDSCPVR